MEITQLPPQLLTIFPQKHCWITSLNKAEIHPKTSTYYQDQVATRPFEIIHHTKASTSKCLCFNIYFVSSLKEWHVKESILYLLPSNDLLSDLFLSLQNIFPNYPEF